MRSLFVIVCFLSGLVLSSSAQVFDYIVAADGSGDFTSVQAAINACPDKEHKIIFIKNGIYKEKVTIGSHAQASNKLLSIIGEDPDKVIITWDDYNGKMVDGKAIDAQNCGTVIVNAADFYAENIVIANTAGEVGPAIALYNVGDRQTFKRCKILGHQDTHRLRKGRRSYFYDCYVEGTVDYIYSGGTAIFDNCQLHTIREGGYITAPEDITYFMEANGKKYYYEFVFRNCKLTSPNNMTYFLGRPWKINCSAVFLSCKMAGVKDQGWSVWSGNNNHETAFFAEHNSMDMAGNLLDVSKRISWSNQLTKEEVDTYYTPEKIYSFISGEYNPFPLIIAPEKPFNLTVSGNSLSWSAVNGAKGYIVYENELIIGFSISSDFSYTTSSESTYSVKAVGQNGNLSETGKVGDISGILGIESDRDIIACYGGMVYVPENIYSEIYSLNGVFLKKEYLKKVISLDGFSKGVYIVKVMTAQGLIVSKINLD